MQKKAGKILQCISQVLAWIGSLGFGFLGLVLLVIDVKIGLLLVLLGPMLCILGSWGIYAVGVYLERRNKR